MINALASVPATTYCRWMIPYQFHWSILTLPFPQGQSISIALVNKKQDTTTMLKIIGVYFWPNQEPRDGWLLEVFQWPLLFRNSPMLSLWTQMSYCSFKTRKVNKREPTATCFSFSLPCIHSLCCLLTADCPEPCPMPAKSPAFSVSRNQELVNNSWYSQSSASVVSNRSHYHAASIILCKELQ